MPLVRLWRSRSTTSWVRLERWYAVLAPMMPPPITTTRAYAGTPMVAAAAVSAALACAVATFSGAAASSALTCKGRTISQPRPLRSSAAKNVSLTVCQRLSFIVFLLISAARLLITECSFFFP